MFKDIEEFKQFIEWSKEAGLSEAKIGDFAFTVSQSEQARKLIAEQEAISVAEQEPAFKDELSNPRAQHIRDSKKDDDYYDTLFHSSE